MQDLTHRLEAAPTQPWPDRPVPIVLVITDLDVGGAERAMVALVQGLDLSRWSPLVIALGGEGALAAQVREAGLRCECLGLDRNHLVQAVARMARAIRQHRACLVQSFLFHANVVARLAAPCAGRPWVVGGLRVAERQKGWHLAVDRMTARLATGSVCVSRGVLRFSVAVGGLDPRRLAVIPNGIDLAPFEHAEAVPRATIDVPEDAHLALAVGRLDEQKGLPHLLDAAERVAGEEAQWHLALAGDGPQRGWLLERIASSSTLSRQVRWLGRRDDVPGLLRSADLLVHASLWEGMPNVVLEAMAAGRPVVATAVEGTEDLVLPGRTGWLIPPADPPALGAALLEAAREPDRCRRLGQEGQRRARAEFSQAATVAAYERLWAGILGYRLSPSPGSEGPGS